MPCYETILPHIREGSVKFVRGAKNQASVNKQSVKWRLSKAAASEQEWKLALGNKRHLKVYEVGRFKEMILLALQMVRLISLCLPLSI